ncbi:MAG TPA: hypothetical protein VL201_03515 [Patescibacteria group bacterium]|jgi:hypothetical protein|nr:hypothetical protein [Patescibacteria group bacterium]
MNIKSKFFLLLYLYINIADGNEQADKTLFETRTFEYNQIKDWAQNSYLLYQSDLIKPTENKDSLLKKQDYFTNLNIQKTQTNDELTFAERANTIENDIKKLINSILINLNKKINSPFNHSETFTEFDTEGSFYFLHKKLIIELHKLNRDLTTFKIANFSNYFNTLKDIDTEYNDYQRDQSNIHLDVDKIEKNTLEDYYHALIYLFVQKKIISGNAFIKLNILNKSLKDKWSLLVEEIKNSLIQNLVIFRNTSAIQFKKQAENIINDIKKINIIYRPKHIYASINNAYLLSKKLIDEKNNRIKNISSLFNTFKEWALKNKLLHNNFEKDPVKDIHNLTSLVKKSILEKYNDLKINYENTLKLDSATKDYEKLYNEIKNLEPKELYEVEDAYNILQKAYSLYEKTTKKSYVRWGIDNRFFDKREALKMYASNLADIIERIQKDLITKINSLSQYITQLTLHSFTDSIKKTTLLHSLKEINTQFPKTEIAIKNSYINWAINNGLLIEDEVINANLETILNLIKEELKERIEQLPKNQENERQIETLKKTLFKATNLSDLSAQYKEYLTIKNNTPVQKSDIVDEMKKEDVVVSSSTQKNTPPKTESWWDWRSWLSWIKKKVR